ncbi:plasmid mobilization relaxosome protein MobC [Ralstonia pseudosolanacearum]|uniref:plasmid mobilization protein n=1 Tax=Ralstonia pseudosolanacearum TaxID=1310165 RepID=UPI000E9E36DD|nr:plasmid mobilization relaxosome protein MobC [Ralstonia solanacearum]
MARPPKDESDKLTKTVAFRLTEGDYTTYRAKFGVSGMSQSEFFREHVLANTTQVIARPVASADTKRAVFLLQKASNNINQLAHRANSENLAGVLSEQTYSQILTQLERLNDFLVSQADGTRR